MNDLKLTRPEMINYPGSYRIPKLISIVSFTFVLLSLLILLVTKPGRSYEISLYGVYPWYFWMLLSVPMALAFVAIVVDMKVGASKFTYVTIAGAILALFILLSIPAFRGYVTNGEGDVLSHLGIIKEIALQGHIGSDNPYPVIHILIYSLSCVAIISPEAISLYITQIFVLLYIVSVFILARSLRCERGEALFIVACAILPALGYWLTIDDILPSTEAYFLIPLALFSIMNTSSIQKRFAGFTGMAAGKWRPYLLISLIIMILIPFFHPEASLFLFAILFVLILVLAISKIFERSFNKDSFSSSVHMGLLVRILAIMLVLVAVFYVGTIIDASIKNAMLILQNAITLQVSQDTSVLISLADNGIKISYADALLVVIRTYWAALVFLAMGAMASLFTLVKVAGRIKISSRDLLLASLFFVLIALNVIFFLIGTPIGIHVYRQLKYPLFVATLIFGIILYRHFRQDRHSMAHSFVSLLLLAVIIVTPVLAVFGMYSSPSVQGINYQVTGNDISGMSFFFSHREENDSIYEIIGRNYQERFSDYLLGYDAITPNVRSGYTQAALTPAHFGYDMNASLGNLLVAQSYVLVYPPSESYYPEIYPGYENLWRYTPDDFSMLGADASINHLYDGGDMKLLQSNNINLWSGNLTVYDMVPNDIRTSTETLAELYDGHNITRVTYTPVTQSGVSQMETYFGKGVYGSTHLYRPDTDYTAIIYFRCDQNITISGMPANKVKWSSLTIEDLGDGWKKATIHHNDSQPLTDNKYWGFTTPDATLNTATTIDWTDPIIEITPDDLMPAYNNLWSSNLSVYNNVPNDIHTSSETLAELYDGHYITRVTYTPVTQSGVSQMETYTGKGVYGFNNLYRPDTDYTAIIYFRCDQNITITGKPTNKVKWDNFTIEDLGDGWKKATIHHNDSQPLTDNKYWGFTIPDATLNTATTIDWTNPIIMVTPDSNDGH